MNPEQNSSIQEPSPETKPLIKCAVVKAEPFATPEIFEARTAGAESIIIISYASGTVPEVLAPAIKSRVELGVPVFLISNNPADSHGIERIKYQAQVSIAEAGAIALKNANINKIEEVMRAIQDETASGKKGADLGKAIAERFGVAG